MRCCCHGIATRCSLMDCIFFLDAVWRIELDVTVIVLLVQWSLHKVGIRPLERHTCCSEVLTCCMNSKLDLWGKSKGQWGSGSCGLAARNCLFTESLSLTAVLAAMAGTLNSLASMASTIPLLVCLLVFFHLSPIETTTVKSFHDNKWISLLDRGSFDFISVVNTFHVFSVFVKKLDMLGQDSGVLEELQVW